MLQPLRQTLGASAAVRPLLFALKLTALCVSRAPSPPPPRHHHRTLEHCPVSFQSEQVAGREGRGGGGVVVIGW